MGWQLDQAVDRLAVQEAVGLLCREAADAARRLGRRRRHAPRKDQLLRLGDAVDAVDAERLQPAAGLERSHSTECRWIVERHDSVGLGMAAEHLLHGRHGALELPVALRLVDDGEARMARDCLPEARDAVDG